MVSATRVPNKSAALSGHWHLRSVSRLGSIDHTISSSSCKFWHRLRALAARRPRLLGRGRRALRAEAARPFFGRNDPPLPAPPRPVPGQSDQGGGLVSAESGPRRPCPADKAEPNRVFRVAAPRMERPKPPSSA